MNRLLLIIGVVLIPLVGTYSSAQDGPVELVTKGCKTEIETNCKNVPPGEGRVLVYMLMETNCLLDVNMRFMRLQHNSSISSKQ